MLLITFMIKLSFRQRSKRVRIEKKQKHAVKANTKLEIIELQQGDKKVEENDIVRLEYDWDVIMDNLQNKNDIKKLKMIKND